MPAQTPPQATTLPQPTPLKYSRDTKRLYCRGVDLNNPVDSIKEGLYPILENLRSYTDGIIQPRKGLTLIGSPVANQTPVHSARRLNNQLNNTFSRIIGTGTGLGIYKGSSSAFATVNYNASPVVFSGNPLALVPWRPDQSPVSWMYVGDSTAMYKVSYDGTTVSTHKIGVAPPTTAPTVELIGSLPLRNQPFANVAGIFTNATDWSASALDGATIAGVPAHADRVTGVGITAVLYDTGSTWASVVPASTANLGPFTLLQIVTGGSPFYVYIMEMYRPSSSSGTAIGAVIYDDPVNNKGLCTIFPLQSLKELQRNTVVYIHAATYVRVLEVIKSPDNSTIAFRCDAGTVANAATIGYSLEVKGSFRVNTGINTITTAHTIQVDSMQTTVTTPGGGPYRAAITYIPPGGDLDLTKTSTYAIKDADYFHFGFKAADVSQIVQARILFDIDDTTFNKNCFYRAFTPADLTAAAKGTQTILQGSSGATQSGQITIPFYGGGINNPPTGSREISAGQIAHRQQYDPNFNPIDSKPASSVGQAPPREVTGTGDSQWSEIRFHRGDCIRVGTDWSRGWQAVKRIRFELTMISGAAVTLMEFSSLTVFGGNGPDMGDVGSPYKFRYRYRCSSTGVASNWSPATRDGVVALRTGFKVTPVVSPAPEVNLIDFQRWGGLVTSWADIGTIANAANYLQDVNADDAAFATLVDSVGDVNFQPWLISSPPVTGTVASMAGTMLQDTSNVFNTSWVKGTGIKVGNVTTSIRRVLSVSLLETEDCIGSDTGGFTAWQVTEPFIAAVALPCLWGPINGWFFACGDITNPGRLYFSNQNTPDSTSDTNFIEVTSPSEPLQNGLTFNGRNYVFSSERMFEILEISTGQFIAREAPTGKGLMYRWAFCVGPRVWFLSKDGVYETDGGIARSITYDSLYPLFPKEGILGTAVNGFQPPNMVNTNLTVSGLTKAANFFFRMSYEDGFIKLYYPDTASQMRCLTYSLGNFAFVWSGSPQTGWYPDVYNPANTNTGILFSYLEEGDGVHNILMGGAEPTTGNLYSYGGLTDNGQSIPWHFRQASWDAGDRRADKVFMDFVVDADPGGGTINVVAGINNYGSTVPITNSLGTTTMVGSGRVQTVFDINTGNGAEARNLAVDLTGFGNLAQLYLIEPSFTMRPENSFLRAIQYDDVGYQGEKFFQGIELEADTQNNPRTVQVQYDGGTLADTLTVTHNGRLQKPYSFASAFVAHLARLIPTDANQWKLFRWRWIYEPEPPLVTVWDSQQTTFGHIGFSHLKAIWVTHTSTADLTLTITRMDDNTSKSFTIPNSGGVRGKETYILLGPPEFLKGKTFKFKITQATNTPFRIYQRNTGVLVKPWGSAQAFARWVGWGADHGDGVAQI